jgi:hypothetical protein
MTASDVELLRGAWEKFSRGDLAAVAAVLDPGVRWHGADDPDNEDGCHNRDEAVAFIERSLADGITSKLLDIRDAGDRLVAVIEAHTPPEWEQPPDLHGEVISIRDGKVTEMVVYGTVEDALSAVGLPAST